MLYVALVNTLRPNLFIQTLALYKSFTYFLTYSQTALLKACSRTIQVQQCLHCDRCITVTVYLTDDGDTVV